MAQTMRWPPQRTPQGGVALTSTPAEATEQSIMLMLTPGISAHPWERQDGIGYESGVYEVMSNDLSPEERDRVARTFQAMERERRAKLVSAAVSTGESGEGKRRLVVEYLDLETSTKHVVEA